ncbi:MAG: MBL fold metallo-hydrolase [Christensenellaceae bacterium]|nr:MBL fold metallo-hydrolase [Christensenellaceae bacterium]
MNILSVPTGPLSVNTYIVFTDEAAKKGGDCVVIDPANSKKVLDEMAKYKLHCSHILLTHGHFDHIIGVAGLKEHENATVMIHSLDAAALSDSSVNLAMISGALVRPCEVDIPLKDNDRFTAAGMDFRVIHTPGHTRGCVCFVMEDEKVIFSGDTLFRLSVGRTDFPGSSTEQLYESILYRLFTLQGDYRVLPGHMRETTLDFERKHNPFMRNGGLDY